MLSLLSTSEEGSEEDDDEDNVVTLSMIVRKGLDSDFHSVSVVLYEFDIVRFLSNLVVERACKSDVLFIQSVVQRKGNLRISQALVYFKHAFRLAVKKGEVMFKRSPQGKEDFGCSMITFMCSINLELKQLKEVDKLLVQPSVDNTQELVTKFLEEYILNEWFYLLVLDLNEDSSRVEGATDVMEGDKLHVFGRATGKGSCKSSTFFGKAHDFTFLNERKTLLEFCASLNVCKEDVTLLEISLFLKFSSPSLHALVFKRTLGATKFLDSCKVSGKYGRFLEKILLECGLFMMTNGSLVYGPYPIVQAFMMNGPAVHSGRAEVGAIDTHLTSQGESLRMASVHVMAKQDGPAVHAFIYEFEAHVTLHVYQVRAGLSPFMSHIFENAVGKGFCLLPSIVQRSMDKDLCKGYPTDNKDSRPSGFCFSAEFKGWPSDGVIQCKLFENSKERESSLFPSLVSAEAKVKGALHVPSLRCDYAWPLSHAMSPFLAMVFYATGRSLCLFLIYCPDFCRRDGPPDIHASPFSRKEKADPLCVCTADFKDTRSFHAPLCGRNSPFSDMAKHGTFVHVPPFFSIPSLDEAPYGPSLDKFKVLHSVARQLFLCPLKSTKVLAWTWLCMAPCSMQGYGKINAKGFAHVRLKTPHVLHVHDEDLCILLLHVIYFIKGLCSLVLIIPNPHPNVPPFLLFYVLCFLF